MGLEHDEVLRNEIAEKDQKETEEMCQDLQNEEDAKNDFLDEQARLRCLEQSWTPTGQEM